MVAVHQRPPRIRPSWQLTRGPLDPALLRAQQLAGMVVGRCTCSPLSWTLIEDISVQELAGRVWVTLRCRTCGASAAHHGPLAID